MSDEELNKLATEMKNITPSGSSRQRGMDAAMAAFGAEFASAASAERVSQQTPSVEEKMSPTQGLAVEPRPTSQNTPTLRVQTFGRETMTNIRKIFDIKPQALMMGGSCMAAIMASFVYFQTDQTGTGIMPPPPSTIESAIETVVENGTTAPPLTVPPVTPPKTTTAAGTKTPSNVVVIERRVMKTPARTEERAIPSVTKHVTRRVRAEDGTFKTVSEPVAVQEASTALVTIPPVYETVRETIAINADGSSTVLKSEAVPVLAAPKTARGTPSVAESEALLKRAVRAPSEIVVTGSRVANTRPEFAPRPPSLAAKAPSSIAARTVPAVTKQVSRRVVKSPARTMERSVPAVTKEVTVRVKTEDGSYKNVTKTFVIEEARTEIVSVPAVFETVTETVVVQDGRFVPPTHANRNQFEDYESNPITSTTETPVSTFSIDVDTASYSFLRASLNRGQLPPSGAIRVEEMMNYFPYDYAAPSTPDEPFKANVTVTPTPWNPDTKLMHIGIKGYVPPVDERPSSNIVFLIDTSGSMNRANKLPLLINSFKLLLNTLDADDTVSIVTYAGSAGTVLEPTPASDKHKIKAALERLRAGGSTAGAAGLELAYQKAAESFDDEGINRVILATDGDFNVGFSSPDEMKNFIKKKRETGIFLSVLGFGNGNYNDQLMQSLAQNGNGVAAYIDTLSEANKVLANESGSALITIAKDVKIQVEFNPETISEYRLIGYETRALKRQDFNNDKVDAGDIGAGHSVTALYEITPVGSPSKAFDPLRYVENRLKGQLKGKTTGSEEFASKKFAYVKIRHKLPKASTSTLQTFPVGRAQESSLRRSTDDMRFAAAVAAVGQKLRGDTQLADFSYDEAIKLASSAKGEDENGYRAEFIQLVRLMKNLEE